MEITIIIALVLYALAIIMAIKLIKNVIVTIGTILLISLLLVAGTGLFVYNEVVEFQETFPVSNNLLLLTEGEDLMSGVVMLPSTGDGIQESMKFLNTTMLDSLEAHLSSEEFDEIRGVVKTSDYIDEETIEQNDYLEETYKVVFIEMDVLKDSPVGDIDLAALAGTTEADSIFSTIPKEDSIEIIKSDEPWDLVHDFVDVGEPDLSGLEASLEDRGFEILNETEEDINNSVNEMKAEIVEGLREGMRVQFGNDDLGSLMFLLNVVSIMEQGGTEGMAYLYEQYSEENIYIKDDSIIFDLLRMSPDSLVTAVIRETNTAASGVGDEVADRTSDDVSNQSDSQDEISEDEVAMEDTE
ncbi:MAG: hypothetical protein ACLFNK_04905 [Candidatus Woesearchaeota archaeon]